MIVFAFLLALTTLAYTQEITGAFGIKFGTKLSDLNVVKIIDEEAVVVDPPTKVKYFAAYAVNITPITKQVYLVLGLSDYIKESECTTLLDTLKFKLEKKYSIKMEDQLSVEPSYLGVKGSKAISIKCSPSFTIDGLKYQLMLQYVDAKLADKAKQERIKLKSKDIDESGL